MIYFALRHKATGKYMPPGKGATYWEPTLTKKETLIRTFRTLSAVKNSKRHWEAGYLEPNNVTDWETGHTEREGLISIPSRIVPRSPDDLEIMQVEIKATPL